MVNFEHLKNFSIKINLHLMKNFLFTAFLLFTFFSNAQSYESVEKKIEKAVNLSSENVINAISLFKEALDESIRLKFDKGILKCKSSLAILYFNRGEYEKVIEYSDDVEELANKLNDYSILTGIYRTVSASYSLLGLNQQAIENLDKSLKYSKYIEDKNIRHYRIGLIYDSYSACMEEMGGKPDTIRIYIDKSINELNQIPDKGISEDILNAKYNVLGIQYIKLGKLYSENYQNYVEAEKFYLQALEIFENPKFKIESTNKIALLSNLSEFYLSRQEYDKSIYYGEEGLKYTNKSEQPELRRQLYNTLFKVYLETNQNDKSKYYSQLYTQLNDSLRYAERSVANTSLKKIITKKEIAYKKNKQIISIISGGILALFLLFILFWKRKNKLIHKKYEVLLEKIQNERKKN